MMTSQANIESSHVNCGFPLISFVTASSKKEYLCMGCLLKDLITNRGSESEKIDILEKVIFGLRATYNIEKSYSDREESVIVGKKFFESLVQAAKVNLHSEAKSDRLVGFFGRAFVVAFCHKFTKKEDVIDLCCQYVIELFERKKAEEESCFLRLIVCVIEKMAEWMNTRKMLFFGPGLENKGYIKCFVFCLLPQLLMISQMAFTSLGVINNFVKAVKLASTIETKDTDFKNNFRKFVDDIIPCVSKYIVSMPNPKVRKNSLKLILVITDLCCCCCSKKPEFGWALDNDEKPFGERLEKVLFSLKSTLLDQDIEMREIALTTIAKILASISHETEKTKVTEEFLSKVYKTGITKFIFENLFLVQSDSPDLDSIVAQYKIAYLSLAIISALGDISGEGSIEFFEEAYKSRTAFLAFLDYVLTHRPRIHRKLLALAEASGSADRKTVCNIREKGTVFNLLNKQGLGLALRYCTMSLKISEARGRELLKCTHEVLSRALRVKGIMGEERQALTIFNILFHSGGGFPGSFPRRLLIEHFEKTLPASKHATKPTSDKQQEEEAEEALLKLGALFTKVEKPGTVVNTLCKTHPTFFARTWAVSCASKSQRGDRLIVSWLSIFINFAERTPAAFCRNEAYSHFKRPILRYALSAIGEFVDGAKVDLAKCFIFCFLRATFGETLNRMWRKALEQVQTTKDLMEFVANTGRPIPFIDKINLMRTILAIATCEMEKVAECEVSPQQILEPPNTKRQKQYWEYEIRYFHNSDMKKLTEELCVLCKMHREVILEPFEMECLVRIAVSSVPKYSHQKNKELKVFNKCIGEIITNKIFESVVGNGSTILPEEVFHWLTLNRQDLAEGWVDRHFVQAVMKAPHAVLPYVNSNYAGLILKTYFKKQCKSYESYDGGIAFLFLLRIVEWEDGRYFKGKSMFCQTILGSIPVIKRMLITCKNKLIIMRFMRITLMELYEKDSKYQRDKYSKYAISIGQMFVELFEVQQISGTEAEEEEMALLLTVLTLLDPQSNFVIHSEESNEVYAQLIKKCEPIVNQAIKALDSPKNKMEFEFEAELYILKYTIKSQIIKIKPILHKFLQLIKSYNNNTSTVALGFQCCCLCITKNEYTKYDNIIITTTVASSVREAVLYALKDLFCEDKDVRNAAVEFVKTVVEVSPPEVLYYIRKQPGHFFCWIKILKMAADGVAIDLSHVVYLGVIAKTLKPEWVSEVLCSKSTYKEAVEMAVDTLHLQLSRCFVASPLSKALRTAIDALDPEGHKKEIREYISEVVADCDNVLLRQQQQLLLMLKVKSVKGNSQVAYFAN